MARLSNGWNAEEAEARGGNKTTPSRGDEAPGQEIVSGARVAVATLGGKVGRVLALRDDMAVVAVGSIKVTVPRAALSRTTGEEPLELAKPATGDLP